MGLQQMVLSAGGGGAVEYDSLADLPAPSVGALAIVGGSVLIGTETAWEYVTLPPPMVPSSTAALGNVANVAALLLDGADVSEIDAPTKTSAWSTVT